MPRLVRQGLSTIQYVGRALGGFNLFLNLASVVTITIAIGWPTSATARICVVVMAALIIGVFAFEEIQRRRAGGPTELLMGLRPLPRVVTSAAALVVETAVDHRTWLIIAAGILMALLVGEGAVRRPVKGATPQAARIKGGDVPIPSRVATTWYFTATTLSVFLIALCSALQISQIPGLIAVTVSLLIALLVGLQSARYLVGRNRFERNLPQLLEAYGPVFAFHWQAPAGTAYQAAMWLPYLERLGKPYFILARTQANFDELVKMTDAPVILRVGLEDLDAVVCSSLKTVFYANTAVRNSHMIRFPQLTHIQLNHGDSDKIASVSPTFRQYDRNFVAGQAAIDRFAKHGVSTLPEQFEIVGRPQLEHVEAAARPIGDIENPTVLYSPTWSGFYDDSDYSSLSAGATIVQELVDRGCTVIFRPHPYARRHGGNARACDEIIDLLTRNVAETGRQHVFGPTAETTMSVVDCFNASDAMVSDVSSVVSDYLISGKPFAMAAVSSHGETFVEEFPLARAAYVFDVPRGSREALALPERLDEMLGTDPIADDRKALRSYYLTDTPPERIADRFIDTALRYL